MPSKPASLDESIFFVPRYMMATKTHATRHVIPFSGFLRILILQVHYSGEHAQKAVVMKGSWETPRFHVSGSPLASAPFLRYWSGVMSAESDDPHLV